MATDLRTMGRMNYSGLPNYQAPASTVTTGGADAYGSIPQQTAMPDPAADLAKVYPNLNESNTALSQNILNDLNAELSPGTIANIRDNAASFGVSSGMPGSDFSGYRGLRNLGLESRDVQQSGLNNYLAATQGISNTQTVRPETQIGLNQSNANLAAAPDPVAAAREQQKLYDAYLNRMSQENQNQRQFDEYLAKLSYDANKYSGGGGGSFQSSQPQRVDRAQQIKDWWDSSILYNL